MPLPRLADFDESTFRGRLNAAGAEPDEIEDRRSDTAKDRAARRRYGSKPEAAPDLSNTKLAKDAGYDDAVRMTDKMRMSNRYASSK